MDSMAITDHGVMYNVIDFYRAAKGSGNQADHRLRVYVAPGSFPEARRIQMARTAITI